MAGESSGAGCGQTPVAGAQGLCVGVTAESGAAFESMVSLTWLSTTLSLFIRVVNLQCACMHMCELVYGARVHVHGKARWLPGSGPLHCGGASLWDLGTLLLPSCWPQRPSYCGVLR